MKIFKLSSVRISILVVMAILVTVMSFSAWSCHTNPDVDPNEVLNQ